MLERECTNYQQHSDINFVLISVISSSALPSTSDAATAVARDSRE